MIALVGARGAGKTSAGRLAAARLARPFVDLDEEIERAGGCPVSELLSESERRFRETEAACLERVLRSGPADLLLALGGGALLDAGSRRRLDACARIWIRASAATLRERLRADPAIRPALLGVDAVAEVEAVLAAREPLYRDAADAIVDADGRSAADVAEDLAAAAGRLAGIEEARWASRDGLLRGS